MSCTTDKSDDQIFNELNLETYDILMRFLFFFNVYISCGIIRDKRLKSLNSPDFDLTLRGLTKSFTDDLLNYLNMTMLNQIMANKR
jgi:hypothetical protein